tara:strand:- start:104 stop:559 length:456 start_codon:yes stop_codon:yes gene_type:complete
MKTLKRIKSSIKKSSSSIYHKILDEEHDIESFLKDKIYRKKKLRALKRDLRKDAKKINEEVQLEKEAILLLKKNATGKKLTRKQTKIVKTSLIDICKVVPSLGIFLLPGGIVLLPLVSKILPFDLMPSAFQDKKKRRKRSKRSKRSKNKRR